MRAQWQIAPTAKQVHTFSEIRTKISTKKKIVTDAKKNRTWKENNNFLMKYESKKKEKLFTENCKNLTKMEEKKR